MRKDSGDRPSLQKQPSAERHETDWPFHPRCGQTRFQRHSFEEGGATENALPFTSCLHGSRRRLTVDDGSAGDLPEDQAQSPDVGLLVGLKHVGADGLVQHLGGHVAFGPHARVVANIQVVSGLRVYDSQS